nr:MAG TPA: hypothetical protein [Caudoviricetes sp.]
MISLQLLFLCHLLCRKCYKVIIKVKIVLARSSGNAEGIIYILKAERMKGLLMIGLAK